MLKRLPCSAPPSCAADCPECTAARCVAPATLTRASRAICVSLPQPDSVGVQAIFRMNQKQLEVAMRRMWSDSSLEADRKAYLMQHIMASRCGVLLMSRAVRECSAASWQDCRARGGQQAGLARAQASVLHELDLDFRV